MSESPDKPERGDEIEATPEDVKAEEATEVVLEADDEAEGEVAPTSEAPGGQDETESEAGATRGSSDADATSEPPTVAAGEPEAPVGPAAPAEEPPPKPRRRRGRKAEEAPAATAAEPEAPSAPAPERRRRRAQPAGPPPVVRARARYVRSSARKARLVCDHIRGKSVEEARAILAHTPRAVARDWSKLLESAVANAEHNHELVGEDLYVKTVHADEGPTIRRFQPRAMGRATRIRKRTSHLTILLTPKE
jgi:ribosomal protein L22